MARLYRSIAALLALPGMGHAAELARSDDEFVRFCSAELEERLFGGAAHGETFIVAKAVDRRGERVAVRLDLASGEGRKISGTCIFRDGKLFDVKQ